MISVDDNYISGILEAELDRRWEGELVYNMATIV